MSVVISGGLIQAVSDDISPSDATTVIDLDGAWITPGFIDPHSHADAAVLTGELMESRAHSGVTTEIVGQDGLGLSHAQGRAEEHMTEILTPIAGDVSGLLCKDVADYLARVDGGAYARVATLSTHGTIRASVMGRDLVPATDEQLSEMAHRFLGDMRAGAMGLSTGLSYPPALASDSGEIVSLLDAAGPQTLYVTHLRSYGKDFDSALDEALHICELSHCRLHLSHFHASGPGREGAAREYLDLLATITPSPSMDSYPYRHACTFLTALLPSQLQDLSYSGLQDALRTNQDTLASEIAATGPEATISVGWEGLVVAGLAGPQAQWNGLSLSRIGEITLQSPEDVICQILTEQPRSPMVLVPQGHDGNIREIAQSSMQVVGSDGIFGSGGPHPRLTGTFFRVLRQANDGVLDITVEEAVAKMTSRTAAIFGLKTGVIAPGYPADLLVMDPHSLDVGDDVHISTPTSVTQAFIGGERTIKDGVWQGIKLSGMAVRGNQ